MFQDIDWCKGQWCPLPRPTLTDEDRAVIEGYGLTLAMTQDMWTGAPTFEGELASYGMAVSLVCRLVAVEGEFAYVWRLRAARSSLLDGLPHPLVVDSEDPLAALAEAVLSGEQGVNDLEQGVNDLEQEADWLPGLPVFDARSKA